MSNPTLQINLTLNISIDPRTGMWMLNGGPMVGTPMGIGLAALVPQLGEGTSNIKDTAGNLIGKVYTEVVSNNPLHRVERWVDHNGNSVAGALQLLLEISSTAPVNFSALWPQILAAYPQARHSDRDCLYVSPPSAPLAQPTHASMSGAVWEAKRTMGNTTTVMARMIRIALPNSKFADYWFFRPPFSLLQIGEQLEIKHISNNNSVGAFFSAEQPISALYCEHEYSW